jgi:hypothetical protein
MGENLLNLSEFYVLTFATTSHALKAEKVLKQAGADFMVIPTLREISSSCGLSVKTRPGLVDAITARLQEERVPVDGVYYVLKQGTHYQVTNKAVSKK